MLCVLLVVLALSTNITLVSAGASTLYSNDVTEDANLPVPDLIRKHGYPIEVHNVTTVDGYILEMHRISHGRDANNVPNITKPVVLMIHGLLGSSAVYVIPGPSDGCGYLLAEAGYDVWMGNLRGSKYSRHHNSLNSDSLLDTRFWEFSWEQNGQFDAPAMIDYVLEVTGKKKLHYLGHSMGTTTFFTMGSLRPEYNSKIISVNALAPIAHMEHIKNLFLQLISPLSNSIEVCILLIGKGEFFANSEILKLAGQAFCRDEVISQPICSNILFLIAGWNEEQHNATLLPIILGHTPAGASVRQLAHYGQGIADKVFRCYDYGSRLANRRVYGAPTPPNFDLGKITVPVFLHYSDKDQLATVPDVKRLSTELGGPMGLFRVPLAKFGHLDFIWGIDAKTLVYERVINLMRSIDDNTFEVEDIDKY